jgi:hypothetical protein
MQELENKGFHFKDRANVMATIYPEENKVEYVKRYTDL